MAAAKGFVLRADKSNIMDCIDIVNLLYDYAEVYKHLRTKDEILQHVTEPCESLLSEEGLSSTLWDMVSKHSEHPVESMALRILSAAFTFQGTRYRFSLSP